MPFKSKEQEKYMYWAHPEIAKRWSKVTKDAKDLPEHVSKKSDEKKKKS